jgi:hypothetical protein
VALALGHAPAVGQPRTQIRWRFSTGASLILGFGQAILMAMAASAIFFSSAALLKLRLMLMMPMIPHMIDLMVLNILESNRLFYLQHCRRRTR